MLAPLPGEPKGWWVKLEQDELIAWAEERAADRVRAERIERLRARCHEVYMRASGALQAAEWDRIQRRRDERDGWGRRSGRAAAWGADRGEVEYSTHDGRVLSVR